MLLLRNIWTSQQSLIRFYAKKAASKMSQHKQVHQETLRVINPLANIKILTDINIKLRSADVIEYPNADTLVAELHGGQVKNCTANLQVNVSDDEKDVEIKICKLAEKSDFHCELAVPLRADLQIEAKQNVNISNMYGGEVNVKAAGNIIAKDMKVTKICLKSEGGDVQCKGLILGQQTEITTTENGVGSEMSCIISFCYYLCFTEYMLGQAARG